jgi:hypothetical protein
MLCPYVTNEVFIDPNTGCRETLKNNTCYEQNDFNLMEGDKQHVEV